MMLFFLIVLLKIVVNFFRQGATSLCWGDYKRRKYTDKNEMIAAKQKILVDNVQFLGGKDGPRRSGGFSERAPAKSLAHHQTLVFRS